MRLVVSAIVGGTAGKDTGKQYARADFGWKPIKLPCSNLTGLTLLVQVAVSDGPNCSHMT